MPKRIVYLQSLAAAPTQLATLLTGLDEALTHAPATAENWAIADIVQHLCTVEAQVLARLQRVVAEERPFLPYIHPDTSQHTSTTPLTDLLTQFNQQRDTTINYLTTLHATNWQKTAVHETEGPVTLSYLIQMIIDHDNDHLNQLQETIASLQPPITHNQ